MLRNWRKEDPCYTAASMEIRICRRLNCTLAQEIAKKSIEGKVSYLIAAFSKMWEERDKLGGEEKEK
jgi:hypothetical protein